MVRGGEAVRAAAELVTVDVDDDGLYQAFEKLELI